MAKTYCSFIHTERVNLTNRIQVVKDKTWELKEVFLNLLLTQNKELNFFASKNYQMLHAFSLHPNSLYKTYYKPSPSNLHPGRT